jgi:DNA-binding transcriptional MocR family regulator
MVSSTSSRRCGRSAPRRACTSLAWLPSGVSEKKVVDGSAALGVKLLGVSSAYREPERAPAGLIFAYGAVTPSEIEDGIRLVAAALATIG